MGRCLSRNLAENQPLGPECRALVIAAAPKACPLPRLPFSLVWPFLEYISLRMLHAYKLCKRHHLCTRTPLPHLLAFVFIKSPLLSK